MKPVDQSLESLKSDVIYFLLCEVLWVSKSSSASRPISQVFCLPVDLQQLKMIYSFVGISLHLHFVRFKVYVSLNLDECLEMVPCHSQELRFAKSFYVAKKNMPCG